MRYILVLLAALFAAPASAASFDCAKAATDIEHAICNDPELSRLDEEMAQVYGQLLPSSRYHKAIQANQRNWLAEKRSEDVYVFEQRLNYLHAYMSLATCLEQADDPQDCRVVERDALDACMGDGDYTTFAMDNCAAAMAGAWDTIMGVESQIKRASLVDDLETLMLFDEAEEAFEAYRQTECGWQFSEYRHGTIRVQIWFGCYLDLTSNRVTALIHGNSGH